MPSMDEQDARDLLIRVDTKVSMIHDNFLKHCEDEASDRQILDSGVKAAHRRLDGVVLSGILTIILLVLGVILQIFWKK